MKIAHGTLVLVADGKKALLFRNTGDEKYPVLETLEHKELENALARDQGEDRSGRTFSSVGPRRSGYAETDWHEAAETRFAREVLEMLEGGGAAEGGVVVLAPPHFLGDLRKHAGRALSARIIAEIPKDLAHQPTDDVAKAIAAHKA